MNNIIAIINAPITTPFLVFPFSTSPFRSQPIFSVRTSAGGIFVCFGPSPMWQMLLCELDEHRWWGQTKCPSQLCNFWLFAPFNHSFFSPSGYTDFDFLYFGTVASCEMERKKTKSKFRISESFEWLERSMLSLQLWHPKIHLL